MQKCKLIILITLMIVMVQLVSGMKCEVSLDNTTEWINLSTIIYGGTIDDTEKKANLPMLEESTTYYIRCRNDTHNWSYTNKRTEEGVKMLSVTFPLTLFGILFISAGIFLIYKRQEENGL